jgi:PIN domain nuclease of toxin-antitoxin system
MTLVEISLLAGDGRFQTSHTMDYLLGEIEQNPLLQILPITVDIARELSVLGVLRDPSDRIICATARVHGLRLLTSDQRIIESAFVTTVE